MGLGKCKIEGVRFEKFHKKKISIHFAQLKLQQEYKV